MCVCVWDNKWLQVFWFYQSLRSILLCSEGYHILCWNSWGCYMLLVLWKMHIISTFIFCFMKTASSFCWYFGSPALYPGETMLTQCTNLILRVNILKFICNVKCLTYNTYFFQDWVKFKIKKEKKNNRKRSACMENIPKIINYWMLEVNGASTCKKILVRVSQKTFCGICL